MSKRTKAIVYGLGQNFHWLWDQIKRDYDVVAIADADPGKQGVYDGYEVVHLGEIMNREMDCILITPSKYQEIVQILLSKGVSRGKIRILFTMAGYSGHYIIGKILENNLIRCMVDNICFDIATLSDEIVMRDIFLYGSWNFIPADKKCAVFDVGMNVGIATLFFASKAEVVSVYGFEPFPKTYQRALQNIRLGAESIKEKIHTYNIGLGKRKHNVCTMYDETYTTNMRTDNISIRSHGNLEKVENVHIENVGEIFQNIINKLSQNVALVMKLDCEGAEYDVLECLEETQLLDLFSIIMLETHDGREWEAYHLLQRNHWHIFAQFPIDGQGNAYAVNQAPHGREN